MAIAEKSANEESRWPGGYHSAIEEALAGDTDFALSLLEDISFALRYGLPLDLLVQAYLCDALDRIVEGTDPAESFNLKKPRGGQRATDDRHEKMAAMLELEWRKAMRRSRLKRPSRMKGTSSPVALKSYRSALRQYERDVRRHREAWIAMGRDTVANVFDVSPKTVGRAEKKHGDAMSLLSDSEIKHILEASIDSK